MLEIFQQGLDENRSRSNRVLHKIAWLERSLCVPICSTVGKLQSRRCSDAEHVHLAILPRRLLAIN